MKISGSIALTALLFCIVQIPASAQESVAERLKRGESLLRQRDYAGASAALDGVLPSAADLKLPQRLALYRYLAAAHRHTVADPADRGQMAARLGEVLEEMAGVEKATPKERLTLLLEAAGTSGLSDDFEQMNRRMDEALGRHKDLDVATVVEALRDAALFFMVTRDYAIVEVLKGRGDTLFDRARVKNSHVCRFTAAMPAGASGWAQSAFVRETTNRESRFHPYPKDQAEMFRTDMAVERSLDEKAQAAMEGRETAFFMAYDAKGWHLYIHSGEPDVEQVMLEDGKGGSTLEMFFAPGQEGEAYYQWIIRLGTGEVSLYNYNTPHRFYRHLEHKPGGFQTETAVQDKGWGTSIFIPWESLYDKLPFMDGNESTWRFSIMRWGPVSLTWGGKVHEPGRWGLIDWTPPTPDQRLAIQRHIVKRAWWKYQAVRTEASAFWQGSRGDTNFYQRILAPAIQEQDQFGEQMKDVDQWDHTRVEAIFKKQVPEWMEFRYRLDELRTGYLAGKLSSDQ